MTSQYSAILLDTLSQTPTASGNTPNWITKKVGGLTPLQRFLRAFSKNDILHVTVVTQNQEEFKKIVDSDPFLEKMTVQFRPLIPANNTQQYDWTFIFEIGQIFTPSGLQRLLESFTKQQAVASRALGPSNPTFWAFPKGHPLALDSISLQPVEINENDHHRLTDNPSAKGAMKKLLKSLTKTTDGPISKTLNRPVSLWVSSIICNWGVTPFAITTFVFLFTLVGIYITYDGSYWAIAIGGIIFHIASVLDGCDGEVARLTYQSTEFGAWYDTLTDNIRYGIFFCILGLVTYKINNWVLYPWAVAYFAALLIAHVVNSARFVIRSGGPGTFLVVTKHFESLSEKKSNLWERIIMPISPIIKTDVSAFLAMVFCLLGFQQIMFWLGCVGITFMAISSARVLKKQTDPYADATSDSAFFVFYICGFSLLAYLVHKIPSDEILKTLESVGYNAFIVFGIAGFWFVTNSLSLGTLSNKKIPFKTLLFNNLVGEGYNSSIPLAGLAGEPFKIRHLSKDVGWQEATRMIIQDRMLHSLAGMLATITGAFLILTTVKIESDWYQTLKVILLAFSLFAAIIFMALKSKLLDFVFKRFRLQEIQNLSTQTVLKSLSLKLIGRVLNYVEIWSLLVIMGYEGTFTQVLVIGTVVSASGLVFFLVPQGIGVNEFSIMGAFKFLGLPTSAALTLGLIRRARILFWSFIGIALHSGLSSKEMIKKAYFLLSKKALPKGT